MRRNAFVMTRLSGFVASILADWRLGRAQAMMPQRAREARVALEGMGPAWIKIGQVCGWCVGVVWLACGVSEDGLSPEA